MKLDQIIAESKRVYGDYQAELNDWDAFQTEDGCICSVDLEIEYNLDSSNAIDLIGVYTAAKCDYMDGDEKVIKTYPAGTEASKLPGYKPSFEKSFLKAAEKDYQKQK